MRTKSILALLLMTAATLTLGLNSAEAAQVNVNINGYLPPPPGVYVQVDAGRPYYVEHDRRVYMEKQRPGKHRKHYKEKRHHDNGQKNGHYKDEDHGGHGGGGGHGH
jgi:hypothetical protein